MIRTIRIDINAAYPNLPLEPVNVFAGSAASFTVCNVPKAVGDRSISAVSLEVKQRAGSTKTYNAVRVGSAYEVTVPAADLSQPYSAALGARVIATGTDENKTAATWVLGVADLNVLNSQGQVVPGSEAGDVKHSEFYDLDPETTPLAVVIERLKGLSSVVIMAVMTAAYQAFAALPVVPVYTNHNRVAGNVQTMTNIQEWASAVEEAIGHGGGVETNAVQAIIEKNVETNYLCTVSAAQAMTNGKADKATTIGGYGITDAYTKTEQDEKFLETKGLIGWNSNIITFNVGTAFFNGSYINTYGIIVYEWNEILCGSQTLPQYLSSGDWNTDSDPFAKMSDIPTPDFTTNNSALVSTITNLAPAKARGISLSDPVRHCNWYQCVTNGVFFWLVED